MIVIKKDNRMVTTFKTVQINVEGSSVIRVPKKQKKEATIKEKREKMIDNLVIKKYPKGLNKIECKHVMNQSRVNSQNISPLEISLLKG
jgi:D-alanine-D-alanine ligase-like ATP-grasp enzyme